MLMKGKRASTTAETKGRFATFKPLLSSHHPSSLTPQSNTSEIINKSINKSINLDIHNNQILKILQTEKQLICQITTVQTRTRGESCAVFFEAVRFGYWLYPDLLTRTLVSLRLGSIAQGTERTACSKLWAW